MVVEVGRCTFPRQSRVGSDRECWGRIIASSRIDLETPKALSKTHLWLAVDHGLRIVVTLHAPNPVVGTVLEIAHTAVSVTHGPTRYQRLTDIRAVVTVGIFQIDSRLPVLDDDAPAVVDQRRRDAQVFGKDRKFISLPVIVGVLADLDPVASLGF